MLETGTYRMVKDGVIEMVYPVQPSEPRVFVWFDYVRKRKRRGGLTV